MDPVNLEILPRRVEAQLQELLQDEAVIAIHGPRSVGKSTVLRRLAAVQGVEVIDLDDLIVRDAVAANPTLAVAGRTPLCVDEYQYVPQILDAIKARLNREGVRPGVAVLTGSTRQDAVPQTAQALTGRLHNLVILPFSQGEISGVHENLLPALLENSEVAVGAHPTSALSRDDYAARIAAGGFPLAIQREGSARNRWFDNYLRSSIDRDAQELTRIGKRQALTELFGHLAGRTAQILNIANVANSLQLDRRTVDEYIRLLEDLFLVFRLPAWGRTLNSRATGTPKIHVTDSGLAARQLRIGAEKLASLDPAVLTEFGHLLETFVVGELLKQVSWLDESATTGHWRTSDGDEIDLVLEFEDGRVLAFEVKANERIAGKDFRALNKLREALGDRFVAGVVLSLGSRSYSLAGERMHVMPVDRLWRPVS